MASLTTILTLRITFKTLSGVIESRSYLCFYIDIKSYLTKTLIKMCFNSSQNKSRITAVNLILQNTMNHNKTDTNQPSIAIVVGGIAGTTSAIHFSEMGFKVTILEKGPSLVNDPPIWV